MSQDYDSSDAGLIAVTVLVTGIVFWMAHVYARIMAASIAQHRALQRAEMRALLVYYWPLVEVTIPLVVVLAIGAVGIIPDRAAILTATVVALVELGAVGAYAARLRGAGLRVTVLSAAVAVGLGLVVVLLKALVH